LSSSSTRSVCFFFTGRFIFNVSRRRLGQGRAWPADGVLVARARKFGMPERSWWRLLLRRVEVVKFVLVPVFATFDFDRLREVKGRVDLPSLNRAGRGAVALCHLSRRRELPASLRRR